MSIQIASGAAAKRIAEEARSAIADSVASLRQGRARRGGGGRGSAPALVDFI